MRRRRSRWCSWRWARSLREWIFGGRFFGLPTKDSTVSVAVTATPIILRNIDARLAELRGSSRWPRARSRRGPDFPDDRAAAESLRRPVVGKLFLQPPNGWKH